MYINELQEGFLLRLQILQAILAGDFAEAEKLMKTADEDKKEFSLYDQGTIDAIDLNALTKRYFGERERSLYKIINELEEILPHQYKDFIICYYYGWNDQLNLNNIKQNKLNNKIQLSILSQSLQSSSILNDNDIDRIVLSNCEQFRDSLLKKELLPVIQKTDLIGLFERLGAAKFTSDLSISNFRAYIREAKESLLHIFGPDLFVIFIAVLDPEFSYDEGQLAAHLRIARFWRCDKLFQRLVLLRSFRGPEHAQSELKSINDSGFDIGDHDQNDNILALYKNLNIAISNNDPSNLLKIVIDLYNSDPETIYWMNIDSIFDCIMTNDRIVNFESVFLNIIFNHYYVAQKYPYIAFSLSNDAVISSLRSAIRRMPRSSQGPADLAAEVAKLGGDAARLFADTMLDMDIAAMVSTLISYDAPWARKLVKAKALSYDARANAWLADLARAFAKVGIIDADRAKAVRIDVESALRVAYLQGRYMAGVVSVDFDDLVNHIDRRFIEKIKIVSMLISSSRSVNVNLYTKKIVDQLSSDLAEYFLFSGPSNLSTTISDSLRHGQLQNRLLQAFDGALVVTAPNLKDVDLSTYLQNVPESDYYLTFLNNLRSRAIIVVKNFNQEHLTIENNNIFMKNILKAFSLFLNELISARQDNFTLAFEKLCNRLKELIDEFLKEAYSNFHQALLTYKSEISDRAEELKSKIGSGEIGGHLTNGDNLNIEGFKSALEEALSKAGEDARKWMALASNERENLTFKFSDVVQLCLVVHTPASGKPLDVVTRVSAFRKDQGIVLLQNEPSLQFKWLDLIESILKNLIGNCIARSGLGRRVRIELDLVWYDDRVEIHCLNTLSSSREAALKTEVQSLQKQVNAYSASKAASDESSGFSKIQWACNRALGKVPRIALSLHNNPASLRVVVTLAIEGSAVFEK